MKNFAIIGIGPRGLYALEMLLINLNKANKKLNITIFEPTAHEGAGPVWDINQAESNWVNIHERALSGLKARPSFNFDSKIISSFPAYHDWSEFNQTQEDPDTFPSRKKIGQYLHERYLALETVLKTSKFFKKVNKEVTALDYQDNLIKLSTNENQTYNLDAILITIGHQPTELSDEMKQWKHFAETEKDNIQFYDNPYSVCKFEDLKNQKTNTINIRGFGLAMIDVMRALTINKFGYFKVIDSHTLKTEYVQLKPQNLSLVPFSLDGKPMAPKPLNQAIDDWYKPNNEVLSAFKKEIELAAKKDTTNNIHFLIDAISKIASHIYLSLQDRALPHNLNDKALKLIISNWLQDNNYKHGLIQKTNISTYKLIERYIQMGLGKIPVSLDYCVGQVWRHCQPTLYASLSHSLLDNEVIEDIIKLDDHSKRYSYGPPIESMQQMLALADANILVFDFVDNPDIKTTNKGWKLTNKDGDTISTNIMINSVLDAPQLLKVNAPLVTSLLKNDLIQPIHTKLGIDTLENGQVISTIKDHNLPIFILGRLCKGSVIGVDALLECFGKRIEDWADAFVKKV
ncbi:FAD/NAD(P)-binding protein [Algibacter pectinivorans]|uniref:FAD-NAD(P)-binding n=1 Tax=Algibacter pectinivorans TaxID=870482 RepID=A0A1I1RIM5_9FLAO|nr:FAD/NAD(P)-binding protein [Algibacter pectinivorans]SFD34175.1 FAD-NAD(P)-binding [Algibacter pectinivorans]